MNTIKYEAKISNVDELMKSIKDLDSYPVFEFVDSKFRIRVLPSFHDEYTNDKNLISFSINGGSFNRIEPQMTCFEIQKKSEVMEVIDKESFKRLGISGDFVKVFFIKTSIENNHLLAYFPRHMMGPKSIVKE